MCRRSHRRKKPARFSGVGVDEWERQIKFTSVFEKGDMPEKTRKDIIKPHLLLAIERLRKFIEFDAPAVMIGAEAWNILKKVLACYGSVAASTMVQSITEQCLHGSAICSHGQCTNYVDRPGLAVCESCKKTLGFEEGLLKALERGEEQFT